MTDLNLYETTALLVAGAWLWHILMYFFFYSLEVLNFRYYLPVFDAILSRPEDYKHNFESIRDKYHGIPEHLRDSYLKSKGYGELSRDVGRSWHYFTLAPEPFGNHFPYKFTYSGLFSLAYHSLFALPYLAVELNYIERPDNFLVTTTIVLLFLSLSVKAAPFILKMRNIKKSSLGLPSCLNSRPPSKLERFEKNYILLNHILLYYKDRGNAAAIHQWIIALHKNSWPIIDDFLHYYCIAKGQHPITCISDFPVAIRAELTTLGDKPAHIFSVNQRIQNFGNPMSYSKFKVWI